MTLLTANSETAEEILKALGLRKEDNIASLTLRLDAKKPAIVDITYMVPEEEGKKLIPILKRYHLKEIEQPTTDTQSQA